MSNGGEAKTEHTCLELTQETHELEAEVTICFQQVITKQNTPTPTAPRKNLYSILEEPRRNRRTLSELRPHF